MVCCWQTVWFLFGKSCIHRQVDGIYCDRTAINLTNVCVSNEQEKSGSVCSLTRISYYIGPSWINCGNRFVFIGCFNRKRLRACLMKLHRNQSAVKFLQRFSEFKRLFEILYQGNILQSIGLQVQCVVMATLEKNSQPFRCSSDYIRIYSNIASTALTIGSGKRKIHEP